MFFLLNLKVFCQNIKTIVSNQTIIEYWDCNYLKDVKLAIYVSQLIYLGNAHS